MKRYLVFAAFVLCCSTVWGRELQVPSVDYNSIQSAIDDANDDDVVTVGAGTYIENIDFLGKAITVQSANPNDPNVVAATIIDGSNSVDPNYGSVVIFRNGEDANSILSGFTITGGTGSWLLVSWENKGLRWNRCGGGAVVRGTERLGLVHGGGQGGVVSRGQGAGQGLYAGGLDDLGMVFEHRTLASVEQRKGPLQHIVLKRRVEGLAERSAQRELAVECARWAHLLCHGSDR